MVSYNITDFIYTPLSISFIAYWGTSFFWLICDLCLDPKYRVPGKINWQLYKTGALYTLVSQIVFTPPILYLLLPLWQIREISTSWDNVYTLSSLKILLCPLIAELVFFYTHKIGHTRFLYKEVHSVHHQWYVTCAVAAAHSHPIEYIFCNLPTFILPALILGLNWYIMNLWFVIATISVVNSHSGYRFEDSIRHAAHHKYYNVNYGPMKILDTIYKTEDVKL